MTILLLSQTLYGADIELKSGNIMEVEIIERGTDYFKVKTLAGINITYYFDEVVSIDGQAIDDILEEQKFSDSFNGVSAQETFKMDILRNFFKIWSQVDQAEVDELLSDTESSSELDAILSIRGRVKEAKNSKNPEAVLILSHEMEAALKQQPDDLYLNYGYGYLLLRLNQYELSKDIFFNLIDNTVSMPILHFFVKFGLAFSYHQLGQCVESIAFKNEIMDDIEKYAPQQLYAAHLNTGICYLQLGDYEKSIESYNKALEYNEHPYAYQNIGITYQKMKDWTNAIKYGKKAIQLSSYNAAHHSLGYAYYENKDYEEALEQYQLALQHYKNTENLNGVGNSYVRLDDLERAEEAYLRSLELSRDNIRAFTGLSWVYNKEFEHVKALEYSMKALRIEPNDNFAVRQLQRAYLGQDKANLSDEEFNRIYKSSIEISNESRSIMAENKLNQGIEKANEALSVNTYNLLAYEYLAYAYYHQGNYDEAEKYLVKVLKLNPYNVRSARNYACTLSKTGRLDEALRVVSEITLKVPNNQEFKNLLEDIKKRNVGELQLE